MKHTPFFWFITFFTSAMTFAMLSVASLDFPQHLQRPSVNLALAGFIASLILGTRELVRR